MPRYRKAVNNKNINKMCTSSGIVSEGGQNSAFQLLALSSILKKLLSLSLTSIYSSPGLSQYIVECPLAVIWTHSFNHIVCIQINLNSFWLWCLCIILTWWLFRSLFARWGGLYWTNTFMVIYGSPIVTASASIDFIAAELTLPFATCFACILFGAGEEITRPFLSALDFKEVSLSVRFSGKHLTVQV